MKRILSLVLAFAVIVTAVYSVTKWDFFANAESAGKDVIFESGSFSDHINPAIEKSKGDKGIWLGNNDNSWLSTNANNQDAPYMGSKDSSGKLLARNKIANNNLTAFEWQFDYRSDNVTKANVSFAFHVNDKSNVSSYSDRKNIFAITLYGSGYTSNKANYYVPNSLNVEYPNTAGAMRPFSYKTSVSPYVTNPSSYVKLDDTTATKAIDLSKYTTINIKVIGRTVVVSAWQTADKANTFRIQTVTFGSGSVFDNAFNTAAPSGDFAIVSGADSGNYKIANMQIREIREIFDSNDYPGPTHVNSSITTSSSDKGIWLANKANTWVSTNANNQDAPFMAKDDISGKLLARNKKLTTSLDDFEWQFEYKPDNANTANTSFAFHVNSNSVISSYSARKNMYAVTLYGGNYGTNSKTLQIEYPTASGMAVAGSLDIGNMMLSGTATTYITVNIRMIGQTVTVSVWQSANKASTYKTLTVDNVAGGDLAPSGDFMVFAGASTGSYRLKNMQMYDIPKVFDSADYKPNKHVNPEVYIPADSGYWLADNDNTWLSTNVNNQDALYMTSNDVSGKILERNKASVTAVDNFEWRFDYRPDKTNKACVSFAFRVNSASNVSGFDSLSGAYAVTLYGSDYSTKNSLVLEYPTANGLTVADVIQLDDSTKTAIELSKYITVDIQMYGGKLCVSVWQTDDPDGTYRTLTVDNIGGEDIAPSGDFVVLGGTDCGNLRMKNMEISVLKDGIISTKPDGIYYTNDFEEDSNGIVDRSNPRSPEKTGLMKDSSSNQYLQLTRGASATNKRGGWTIFNITDNNYTDFTLNMKVKLDPALNPDFSATSDFMLICFRSKNGNIDYANILQIAAKGAAFSVADKTDADNAKTYTNNRIAYAGKNTTDGKTFNLPTGNAGAGLSANGVWHKISLVVKGYTYKYYLDGVLMMEVEDKEKLYKSGKIHVNACREDLQIDDVEILIPDVEITPFEAKQLETGLIYENKFDSEADIKRINVTAGVNYGIVTEGEKSYFHIDYKPSESNAANGDTKIYFGPTAIKNFTLNFNVRITNSPSDKWHSIIPMGRINSGLSVQARLFTKGSYLAVQDDSVINEVSRTGPAAPNHNSTNPCHDKNYGISIHEWHKVSLVCDEFKYTLYVDGKKILEGEDKYQLTKWGSFGLRTQGVNMDIDDIRIWGTPHYDISFTEEVPAGTLYENNFESESTEGIKFIYYDKDETKILSDEDGNKFLRAYPNTDTKEDGKPVVTGAGNLMFSIGPPNTMDFELTYKLRLKSNTNENSGFALVGIHSDPANIKWNSVWINMLARGTSVSLKDNSRKLGIDNLIAKTGKNRSGGTQYQPSDNRAFGIRPDGKWHDIKVICKGYTYTLYVDGNEYISVTDTDKTFYKGYTVLGSNSCKIDIDDIKMTNN